MQEYPSVFLVRYYVATLFRGARLPRERRAMYAEKRKRKKSSDRQRGQHRPCSLGR